MAINVKQFNKTRGVGTILVQLTGTQAGKKAHYMLRWVNTRGEKGPWTDTASATVTG